MGGERDMARLLKPKADYPVMVQKPVAKLFQKLYLDRIEGTYKTGAYEKWNLQALLNEGEAAGEPHVYLDSWAAPDLERPTFEDAVSQEFDRHIKVGSQFGPAWSTHWVKVRLTVPEELRDKEHLEFHWDAGNEGMVWTEDGNPIQGFSASDRPEWILPEEYRDGKEHTFYIEVACNEMFGNGAGISPPDPNKTYTLRKASIVAVNLQARQLYVDMWIIGDAARELPKESWEQHEALKTITRMIEVLNVEDKDSVLKAREIARGYIGNVDSAEVYESGKEPMVYGVGHCHIDTCWLWPWAETKRKVARSWTNQCNLMELYPELNFACSQAQQFKWLKQYYPYAFDRVKEKVKAGQFQPIGGSWVEHDTNMPSGESLVRQFVYGQRFFEANFGDRSKTFWLPDTFGYSAQLPQLCRLAGMDRFLTQKLSWNNINNFPHTTFNWVAIDGSQVMCHMPPSETYTANAHYGDVKRSISKHKSMDQDHTSLLVFGKGDGGGGPLVEHIEKLRRCRGMADTTGTGAVPRIHMGKTVDDFFDQLLPKSDKLVTWFGELYFELHRGTYTTQANNKHNNRASEFLLRAVELYATIASLNNEGYQYPKASIDKMWEAVLLCQFHDCLPGSCIEMCYDDSDKLYAEVFEIGHKLIAEASSAMDLSRVEATTVEEGAALNALFWPRQQLVQISDDKVAVACGDGPLLELKPLESLSAESAAVSIEELSDGVFALQNDQLKVKVENGVITSVYDRKADREVLAKGGKANQFVIFDDKPLYWQAWDVEWYHLDSRKELSVHDSKISENKPHRVAVSSRVQISEKSHLVSTVSLSASLKGQPSYVEIETEVEWHEDLKFLKVEFPVDVRNTEANYEIQYGIVKRPTHYNTDWDMAKFEVCHHKFADLSERNYGVSILNDSKYGFATVGNLMRLSLLRAPKAPDAHADMGPHKIRYAILPHDGPLGPATVRAGYEFNSPIKLVRKPHHYQPATAALSHDSPVKLVGDHAVILDCVKRGEDDEDVSVGDLPVRKGKCVIVRMYESLGGRARTAIGTKWNVKKVTKVNILEDEVPDEAELQKNDEGNYPVTLRPFEVATFRLQL
ncbi:family 38 glycoside hydrolase [Cryphonectria parasitica EP155]|uniref:Alpha-mannosidase n=1 Tax=Cryphonectria parasitica (strain ATCC 38755 / EP155) TaxID=660469 RepID=A0A9P5CKT9_CRYP1|nr:family 38 glycoside hydrolase [Cryphonectria parasitica EP155]KAF3762408.1 family 38 glycoside hydrolase [Cryphonectria parasitica EP155]